MKIDVVNAENKKVGSVDLNDDVFGGRVKTDLIHESVVRANAAERRSVEDSFAKSVLWGFAVAAENNGQISQVWSKILLVFEIR